jgi:hypothetical protein
MLWELLTWLAIAFLHCPAMFFWAGCPCCGCECEFCDATPAEMDVTISGLSNQDCTDCGSLNDTYTLACQGQTVPGADCYWQFDFPASFCNSLHATCRADHITLAINANFVVVHINSTSIQGLIQFVHTDATDPKPCATYSGYNVTGPGTAGCDGGTKTICNVGVATCTISAA